METVLRFHFAFNRFSKVLSFYRTESSWGRGLYLPRARCYTQRKSSQHSATVYVTAMSWTTRSNSNAATASVENHVHRLHSLCMPFIISFPSNIACDLSCHLRFVSRDASASPALLLAGLILRALDAFGYSRHELQDARFEREWAQGLVSRTEAVW